jgi:hypothetical protein
MKWIEGIHYEKLENGSLKCLKCQKELKGPSALGPHLSVCWREESKEPTAPTPLQPSETGLTMQDQLRQYLNEVGFRKADAVITLVERYGYNVLGIYAALKDTNANLSVIRYVLKAWASYNNEPIPEWILKEINAQPIPGLQYYMPQQQEGEALKKEELPQILNQWWTEKEKEREIEALKMQVQELRQQLSEGNPSTRKSEVEALREELAKMRQDEMLKRLEKIESQLTGPIQNIYGLCAEGIRTLKDLVATSPIRYYIAYGQLPKLPPKEIEEGANTNIFSRLNQKYVSEE